MKRLIFTLLLLPCFCFGQNNEVPTTEGTSDIERNILKVQPLLLPSLGIETRLTDMLTLYNHIGLLWGFTVTDGNINQVLVAPFYSLDLRAYHSLKKRREKGRRTDGFSGNYIQWHNYISTDRFDSGAWVGLLDIYSGIHYGLQRRFTKHLYFDGNIGAGYSYLTLLRDDYYSGGLFFDFELSLGYSF